MERRRPRALVIQHVAPEPPSAIASAFGAAGVEVEVVRVDRGEPVPVDSQGFSGLVVMGGSMGVGDAGRLEHLSREMKLIESALKHELPLLGVCLGSELLAHVLGARVAAAGFLELGWLPVYLTADAVRDSLLGACPPFFTALHWHGDAFDLPPGAVHLVRSDRTTVQGFRYRQALGLLFHLEADQKQVKEMAEAFPEDLARGGSSLDVLLAQAEREVPRALALGGEIYRRFARLALGSP
jgi:GMP synthase (glutamine-hydrolysing)